jgi:hypothetical protein
LKKLLITSKINTLFLAFVLVAGMIVVSSSSSSFMTEAKAEPEYGMDSYKEYKDNSNVEKIECSNININNNGIDTRDADLFSETHDGDGLETTANTAEEYNGQQLSSQSIGNNERNNGFKQNDEDVKVVCKYNNNNDEGGQGNQTEEPTCEECFTQNLNTTELNIFLTFLSNTDLENLEGYCEEFLSNTTLTNDVRVFFFELLFNVLEIDNEAIFDCLEELGIITRIS